MLIPKNIVKDEKTLLEALQLMQDKITSETRICIVKPATRVITTTQGVTTNIDIVSGYGVGYNSQQDVLFLSGGVGFDIPTVYEIQPPRT